MASGILVLLDDVAALMDDVAVLSKIATKKTAGILGDDLAVNAEKAMGFVSSREIPVLWAITKGAILNKLIILPVAFLLSWLYPPAITAILLLGGLYLAYEGAHKIASVFIPHEKEHKVKSLDDKKPSKEEVLAHEKAKIKSAITTDFILSIEIIIIAMNNVEIIINAMNNVPEEAEFIKKILAVSFVAFVAVFAVYGVVALIVRMDDFGYKLIQMSKGKSIGTFFGKFLVNALPWVIKTLNVVGTIALVLVAGEIYTDKIDFLHHLWESWPPMVKDFTVGLIVGFSAYILYIIGKKIWNAVSKK